MQGPQWLTEWFSRPKVDDSAAESHPQLDRIAELLIGVQTEARSLIGRTDALSAEVAMVRSEIAEMRKEYAPMLEAFASASEVDRLLLSWRPKPDDTFGK